MIDRQIGDEKSLVYFADFKGESLYQKNDFTVTEEKKVTKAKWFLKDDLFSGEKVLYPNGFEFLKLER